MPFRFRTFIMVIGAGGPMQLTNNPDADDSGATWSPDGTRIAFTRLTAGDQIYMMNADGSNQTQLTNTPGGDGGPAWSPDGTKIAFTSTRNGSLNPQIYVMDVNGSNHIRLTQQSISRYRSGLVTRRHQDRVYQHTG